MGKRPVSVQKKVKKLRKPYCELCKREQNLQAHHIIRYSLGGATNAENLITLCAYHHKLVHEGVMDIFVGF